MRFFSIKREIGKYFCLFLMIFVLGIWGCNEGSSHDAKADKQVTGQALLGPLVSAQVYVYPYAELQNEIYATTTTYSQALSEAGIFSIPADLLTDDELYLIKISGGEDIDADDDGVLDDTPTPNQGTLHLVAFGKELMAGDFKVNILTDIVYRKISYLLMAGYPNPVIETYIRGYINSLLRDDLNGDGNKDTMDLMVWDPVTERNMASNDWDFLQACASFILQDSLSEYRDRLSSIAMNIIGTVKCNAGRVAVEGNYVYVADKSSFGVIDISDPENPFLHRFS